MDPLTGLGRGAQEAPCRAAQSPLVSFDFFVALKKNRSLKQIERESKRLKAGQIGLAVAVY